MLFSEFDCHFRDCKKVKHVSIVTGFFLKWPGSRVGSHVRRRRSPQDRKMYITLLLFATGCVIWREVLLVFCPKSGPLLFLRVGQGLARVPYLLIVYHVCSAQRHKWSLSNSRWPTVAVSCTDDPENDCYEAVPYLDFIIRNYDERPAEVVVFTHAHDVSWHYRRPFWRELDLLVGSSFFRHSDIGGVSEFRWSCGPKKGKGLDATWYSALFREAFRGTSMEGDLERTFDNSHPCCSSYFVNWRLIRTRPLKDYVLLRSNLVQWSRSHWASPSLGGRKPGYFCGRLAEYNWHFIFTNHTAVPKRRDWELKQGVYEWQC